MCIRDRCDDCTMIVTDCYLLAKYHFCTEIRQLNHVIHQSVSSEKVFTAPDNIYLCTEMDSYSMQFVRGHSNKREQEAQLLQR